MRLKPTIGWKVAAGDTEGLPLDPRLPALVMAAARRGTLGAAARDVGLSYRAAWGLLEQASALLGDPLLVLARGKGARLAPLGERWLAAHRAASERVADSRWSIPVEAPEHRPAVAPLTIAASHDIALAQLRDRWRSEHGVLLEFMGSARSLATYVAGSVDVAGFHVAAPRRGVRDPLLQTLDARRDALLSFLRREQGLIVAPGNPRRVKSVADIAAKRLVFVNRQPDSGTRLLFDRLLARHRIDAASIAGYTSEEFTHAAVAATVASGRADVGFGIAAAAAQFGLAFVPLVREHYFFVCRRRQLQSARIKAFRTLIASDATRAVVVALPGYRLEALPVGRSPMRER